MTGPDADATGSQRIHPVNDANTLRVATAIVIVLALIAVGMVHFVPAVTRLSQLGHGNGTLFAKFLLAIVLIITVGSFGGWLAARFRQPRVVGEMVAGIALGPSLFGQFAPEAQHWLFPSALGQHLSLIATLTIIVFVFLLGANLHLGLLRGSGRRVAPLGIGMVVVPVVCGILLASGVAGIYRPEGVALLPFLLFVGVSMGVTAFPVLVRILDEHSLVRSRIGILGLTAAGIGDVIAWCLLIVAITAARGDSGAVAVRTVTLLVIFSIIMWTGFRPALYQFLAFAERNIAARFAATPILLLSAVSGALITDQIGVHAIFGAFMVGLAVPRDNALVQNLTKFIERGVAVILPLFFAVIGLNVIQIGFLTNMRELLTCVLVLVVAIVSKVGTTTLIARFTKLDWHDSLGLGVMMNCRGLTELVVITTGLSLGIIEQNLFTILVVMTLVTTIMTGPLLKRLDLGGEPAGSTPPPAGSAPPATVRIVSATD